MRPNLSAVLRVACLSLAACTDAASRTAESGEPMVQVNPQDLQLVAVDSGINELLDLAVTDDAIWAATHGQVRAVRYRFENPVREEVLHGGGGPEEVREVTTVAPDTSGGVVVWDARTGRVLRIGGDRRIETIRRAEWLQAPLMARLWYFIGGLPNQVAAMKGGILVGTAAGGFRSETGFRSERVSWVEPDGPRTFLDHRPIGARIDSLTGHGQELAPFPLWSPCGHDRVADYDPSTHTVSILSLSGDTLRQLRAEREFAPMSLIARQTYGVIQMLKTMEGIIPEENLWRMMRSPDADSTVNAFSKLAAAYVSLLCSPAGEVWLERFELADMKAGRSGTWDVYRPGGTMTTVRFPPGFRLFDLDSVRLAGAVEDSLGIQSVYTIPVAAVLSREGPK